MRCDQCVYWKHDPAPWDHPPEDIEGHCHRYPPVFDTVTFQIAIETETEPFDSAPVSNYWTCAVTCPYDWCGEFKEKCQ